MYPPSNMYTYMYTCNFQRPLVEGGSTIISIAFMFSPIYLILEDNVPPLPPPPEIEIELNN